MKHGNYAVTLLTETNPDFAQKLAAEIETFNTDRRHTDKRITEEALQLIEKQKEQECFTTVVYKDDWHKGVIGIVASRLTETYYRPTLVFTKSGNKLVASARSVSGFDVYNALEACSEHIEQFGGHKYAAGLTLAEENYEAFKQAFEDEVCKTIDPKLRFPEIRVDMEIDLNQVDDKLMRIITVKQSKSNSLVCIGFGMGDKLDVISGGKPFKAVYSIDENEWQGQVSLQLKLRDIKG